VHVGGQGINLRQMCSITVLHMLPPAGPCGGAAARPTPRTGRGRQGGKRERWTLAQVNPLFGNEARWCGGVRWCAGDDQGEASAVHCGLACVRFAHHHPNDGDGQRIGRQSDGREGAACCRRVERQGSRPQVYGCASNELAGCPGGVRSVRWGGPPPSSHPVRRGEVRRTGGYHRPSRERSSR